MFYTRAARDATELGGAPSTHGSTTSGAAMDPVGSQRPRVRGAWPEGDGYDARESRVYHGRFRSGHRSICKPDVRPGTHFYYTLALLPSGTPVVAN